MNEVLTIVFSKKAKEAEVENAALRQTIFELEHRLAECENGYEGTLFLERCKLHDAEEKIQKLTAESERYKREATNLRAQLFFLDEGSRQAVDKETARHMVVNDIGQHFCPRCHACVYDPPGVSAYWKRCRYTSKAPPEYCPRCGQHLMKSKTQDGAT